MFRTRREARVVIETWRQHYNAVSAHMSLNYLTPTEFRLPHLHPSMSPNRAVLQEQAVRGSWGRSPLPQGDLRYY